MSYLVKRKIKFSWVQFFLTPYACNYVSAKMESDGVGSDKKDDLDADLKDHEEKPKTPPIKLENGEHSDVDSYLMNDVSRTDSPGNMKPVPKHGILESDDNDSRSMFSLPEEMAHILSTWPKVFIVQHSITG